LLIVTVLNECFARFAPFRGPVRGTNPVHGPLPACRG
jgi:hypothetical protein